MLKNKKTRSYINNSQQLISGWKTLLVNFTHKIVLKFKRLLLRSLVYVGWHKISLKSLKQKGNCAGEIDV